MLLQGPYPDARLEVHGSERAILPPAVVDAIVPWALVGAKVLV